MGVFYYKWRCNIQHDGLVVGHLYFSVMALFRATDRAGAVLACGIRVSSVTFESETESRGMYR
jgi:hypothetical protein